MDKPKFINEYQQFRFRYRLHNVGKLPHERLCENFGCEVTAPVVVEDGEAIYCVCAGCASLIPGGNILTTNGGS